MYINNHTSASSAKNSKRKQPVLANNFDCPFPSSIRANILLEGLKKSTRRLRKVRQEESSTRRKEVGADYIQIR
jgi:hypothetical protein